MRPVTTLVTGLVAGDLADARAVPERTSRYQRSSNAVGSVLYNFGRMKPNLRSTLMALAVAAAAAAALRRRPVKPPQPEGTWQPVHK